MEYKISIVIPVYNVEAYIIDCLQSVAAQAVSDNIECILVDDCGNDNSMSLAQRFIDAYKGPIHFVIFHHGHNKGLSEARNTAMREAKGEYIYFLDSDDMITPDCMEEMCRLIGKYPSVDMVISNNDINDILYMPFGEYTTDAKVIIQNLLYFNGRAVAAQRHMVRSEVVRGNNLSFYPGIIHEDNLWTFLLSRYIHSIAFSSKDLYYYRKDNLNSIMRNKKIVREIQAYRTIIEKTCINLSPNYPGIQKKYIFHHLQFAIRNGYYEDEHARLTLVNQLLSISSFVERMVIKLFFSIKNVMIQRMSQSFLFRLYALSDRQNGSFID